MSEITKTQLSEEEKKELQELLNNFHNITVSIGDKALRIDQLKKEKDMLIKEYAIAAEKEKEIVKVFNKKYGIGKINTADWTFEAVIEK